MEFRVGPAPRGVWDCAFQRDLDYAPHFHSHDGRRGIVWCCLCWRRFGERRFGFSSMCDLPCDRAQRRDQIWTAVERYRRSSVGELARLWLFTRPRCRRDCGKGLGRCDVGSLDHGTAENGARHQDGFWRPLERAGTCRRNCLSEAIRSKRQEEATVGFHRRPSGPMRSRCQLGLTAKHFTRSSRTLGHAFRILDDRAGPVLVTRRSTMCWATAIAKATHAKLAQVATEVEMR